MKKYLSLPIFMIMLIYLGCSDNPKGTDPVIPGHNPVTGTTTFSDTGDWSVAGANLILRSEKTEGGCIYDSALNSVVYSDTMFTLIERMPYTLTGDTQLIFTDLDTVRNKNTGQVIVVRSERFTYRRIGTGTALPGTWVSLTLPTIDYVAGTVGRDTHSIWSFAVGFRDTFILKTDSTYGHSQFIQYSSAPDSSLQDSIARMLQSWVTGVPGGSVVTSGSTVTVSTDSLAYDLVITQAGTYPNSSLTASYKGTTATQYRKPDTNLKCQGEAALGEVLGLFYQDLYATGKRREGN